MRVINLFEDYQAVTDKGLISNNFSTAIQKYKDGSVVLYRGMGEEFSKPVIMQPRSTSRTAAYAKMNIHNELINSGTLGNLPKREIIMSANSSRATTYGMLYICLPMNGAVMGDTGALDIFESFRPNIDMIDSFYFNILSLFLTVRRIIRKEYDYEPPYIEIETVADLQKSIDTWGEYGLNNYITDIHTYSQLPITLLKEIINTRSSKPIINMFKENTLSSSKLDNLVTNGRNEYWTDSPTLLIPYDKRNMIEKF